MSGPNRSSSSTSSSNGSRNGSSSGATLPKLHSSSSHVIDENHKHSHHKHKHHKHHHHHRHHKDSVNTSSSSSDSENEQPKREHKTSSSCRISTISTIVEGQKIRRKSIQLYRHKERRGLDIVVAKSSRTELIVAKDVGDGDASGSDDSDSQEEGERRDTSSPGTPAAEVVVHPERKLDQTLLRQKLEQERNLKHSRERGQSPSSDAPEPQPKRKASETDKKVKLVSDSPSSASKHSSSRSRSPPTLPQSSSPPAHSDSSTRSTPSPRLAVSQAGRSPPSVPPASPLLAVPPPPPPSEASPPPLESIPATPSSTFFPFSPQSLSILPSPSPPDSQYQAHAPSKLNSPPSPSFTAYPPLPSGSDPSLPPLPSASPPSLPSSSPSSSHSPAPFRSPALPSHSARRSHSRSRSPTQNLASPSCPSPPRDSSRSPAVTSSSPPLASSPHPSRSPPLRRESEMGRSPQGESGSPTKGDSPPRRSRSRRSRRSRSHRTSRSPRVAVAPSSPPASPLALTPPSAPRAYQSDGDKKDRKKLATESSQPTDDANDSPLAHSPLLADSPRVRRRESPVGEEPPTPKKEHKEDDDDDELKGKLEMSDSDTETKTKGGKADDSDHENDKILYHLPALMGCRSVNCYRRKNKIDEGQYGEVFRAEDKITGEIVALKKIKINDPQGGFPITSLREINILLSIAHPNIVGIKEIVTGEKLESIFMVMEYMDHDLKMLMRSLVKPFSQAEVKCLLKQLLQATEALHQNWVLHRDLKTSNLLLNNKGILKVCDFGLARLYGSPLGHYTGLVVTLWYRCPELLLGTKLYSGGVDMWSVGCIFAEFLLKEPLLPGKSECHQLNKIIRLLGTPTDKTWPGFKDLPLASKMTFPKNCRNRLRERFPKTSYHGGVYLSDCGFDLLSRMLCYDPAKRITATDALKHPYFNELPKAYDPSQMRAFPSLNEDGISRRNRHRLKAGVDPNVIREEQQMSAPNGFFLRDS